MLQLDDMCPRFKENSGGCDNSCTGYYTPQGHRSLTSGTGPDATSIRDVTSLFL